MVSTTLFCRRLDQITDADILRLASSRNPYEASFGRLLGTGIAGQVSRFIDGEFDRRAGLDPVATALVNIVAHPVVQLICATADDDRAARLAIEQAAVNFSTILRVSYNEERAGISTVGGSS